ncbi:MULTISPECIES: NfeD family protein [unclassified Salinibacterium]|uniref:NfeD family protein n=1 Tax=unclassified Salinibacterium TaxID=2632331 RepID=UPI00142468AE|nr:MULTISPECIES: NfeD family protein [unclassified Salinibacterium]
MTADFLTTYAWVFWLALILIFVIIEVSTVDFSFLMLGVGCLGGLISGLFGAPWWLQVVIAALLSLLLLFTVRPPLLRALKRGGDPARSNVDALLGMDGRVMEDFFEGAGHVKLANGETWTARLSSMTEDRPLIEGERVVVTAIEGATAVVIPVERTAE